MAGKRSLETGTPDLIGEVEERVAWLTLNRPERRNALSDAMLAGLGRTLEALETDPEVGCVVLTGAGGAFCAGGDVKALAEGPATGSRRPGLDELIHLQRLSQRATAGRLHRMPKPTLAALPGAAAGAGLSLALACDLRIASEAALLTTAFANVGFSGDYGGTWFMTRLVGAAKTQELYLLSEKLGAPEALRLGLVNRVVPAASLEAETRALATRLAHGPAVAYRYMKENIHRAMAGGEFEDCLDLEATHHVHTALSEDHRNAVAAFVAKRKPVFAGR